MIRIDSPGASGSRRVITSRAERFWYQRKRNVPKAIPVQGQMRLLWVPDAASRLRECGAPYLNPNNLIAFSFRISGRTSGLMSIASKSLSQRSGEMTG